MMHDLHDRSAASACHRDTRLGWCMLADQINASIALRDFILFHLARCIVSNSATTQGRAGMSFRAAFFRLKETS